MTPLLEMLEKGNYYIGYINIFPITNEGNFFWNYSNDSKILTNTDYCYFLPLYIRASENYNFYNEDRLKYYLDRYDNTNKRPTPIVINCQEYENIVIDGHHKILASYLRNEPIRAIMIMRCQKKYK